MSNRFQKVASELKKLAEALSGFEVKAELSSKVEDALADLRSLGDDLMTEAKAAMQAGSNGDVDLEALRHTVEAISATFDTLEYDIEESEEE